ncbi:MAG: dephospho-CoA kinase [Alteromonadaceae bacterium]|nr:dephospho-CoA kinase [Alteromonadaceae bacterium]MBH86398.1 dephospho-CoA kinase [Alteromonadaceae bacterium]|tara:strand:+ start:1553 stop:2176 length:624 start_codon:yes stop_codon:yes gene_type:complete
MKVVGLTGGIGSGKSTIAARFKQLGVHAVDADDVAREVVEPGRPALAAIAAHFGDAILLPDGALNRAVLRQIVFETPEERDWLEKLLHPIIRDELLHQLWITSDRSPPAEYQHHYVLLVSPLLLETDQHNIVDSVIVIDVPVEVQIARTMQRDKNDRAQVERIINAQISREERLKRADFIIDNAQPASLAIDAVDDLHYRLNSRAKA